MNDWCHREAHLELSRREKAGIPLVSPDYVPIENIKLPSDEELGDMEIVI
jgi:NADH dehydrogenase (ubiquinone) 1 beta subcomplex subunit 11